MLITAPAEQFLTGYQLIETRCQYCKTTLGEGDPVSAYAVRYAGDEEWSIPCIYCRDCQSTITDPTLGATELLAEGHLGVTMDATTQRTTLTLLGIERIIRSEPEEGHVTL
ncbi:hypothetical protein [Halalkalicoccus jeotgali]|uniref:DUF8112 domain-containing protein n=1 Tax=Halalkalicoccus jeotgali (strain DSM 18796 / CECT 7217 / JCM 14584 / KCTC 4019 / B3) TaxID=795797 RepID=D8J6P8_HALJB|nr:hypothetical protein [Halalkalicoccus jeotgali]ADJ13925.1 hypothetical protein HacjB3_02660 [Halalkalicoccus jeotgali B3]ELY34032.1 hypothetical protein C497_16662 [Halalkalicoccus jeotgali B3]